MNLAVEYSTPRNKLELLPQQLKKSIAAIPNVTVDRAHLVTLGDVSIKFEMVYFVTGVDPSAQLDVQQAVNFAVLKLLEENAIVLAYPTQTIKVHRS